MLRLLIIVCLLISSGASADTLYRSDLIGSWVIIEGENPDRPASLIVNHDFSASFKHSYLNGEDRVTKTSANAITKYDGAWSIKFDEKHQNISYKLVFSGWRNRKSKSMFGVLYVYHYGVLNNGLSVSLDQLSPP